MPWSATALAGRQPSRLEPQSHSFVRLKDHSFVPTCRWPNRRAQGRSTMAEGHRRRRRVASLTGASTAVHGRQWTERKSACGMKKTVAVAVAGWHPEQFPPSGAGFARGRRPIDQLIPALWVVCPVHARATSFLFCFTRCTGQWQLLASGARSPCAVVARAACAPVGWATGSRRTTETPDETAPGRTAAAPSRDPGTAPPVPPAPLPAPGP